MKTTIQKLSFAFIIFIGIFIFNLDATAQDWNVPVGLTNNAGYFGTTSGNDAVFYAHNGEKFRLGSSSATIQRKLQIYGANPNGPSFEMVYAWGMGAHVFIGGIATANGNFSSIATTGDICLTVPTGGDLILANKTSSDIKFSTGTTETQKMIIQNDGKVGIGFTSVPTTTLSGGYKLAVSGNANIDGSLVIGTTSAFTASTPFPSGYTLYVSEGILTEKIKVAVKTSANWADFVFAPEYKLMPLESVEKFVKENKHLPDVPSADEVVNGGLDLGKMDATLLQKIEELTLYMIDLKNQNEEVKKQNEELKSRIEILEGNK